MATHVLIVMVVTMVVMKVVVAKVVVRVVMVVIVVLIKVVVAMEEESQAGVRLSLMGRTILSSSMRHQMRLYSEIGNSVIGLKCFGGHSITGTTGSE
jgi:hypothetical protein